MATVPGAPINGNGRNGNGRPLVDPFGGIPKELRPDMTHLLMSAAMHAAQQQAQDQQSTQVAMDISGMRRSKNIEDARQEYLLRDPALSDVPMTKESYGAYREQQDLTQIGIKLGQPDLPKRWGKINPLDPLR